MEGHDIGFHGRMVGTMVGCILPGERIPLSFLPEPSKRLQNVQGHRTSPIPSSCPGARALLGHLTRRAGSKPTKLVPSCPNKVTWQRKRMKVGPKANVLMIPHLVVSVPPLQVRPSSLRVELQPRQCQKEGHIKTQKITQGW